MRRAAEYLLALGHRRFLYIEHHPDFDKRKPNSPKGNYHEIERSAGLREAVSNAGLPPDAIICWPGKFDFESGVAAAESFLGLTDRLSPRQGDARSVRATSSAPRRPEMRGSA